MFLKNAAVHGDIGYGRKSFTTLVPGPRWSTTAATRYPVTAAKFEEGPQRHVKMRHRCSVTRVTSSVTGLELSVLI